MIADLRWLLREADGDATRQPRPAVVSFARWQELGGRPDVLNRPLMIGNDAYVIVGVAPRGFHGLLAGRAADVWIPLTPPSERAPPHRVLASPEAKSAAASPATTASGTHHCRTSIALTMW